MSFKMLLAPKICLTCNTVFQLKVIENTIFDPAFIFTLTHAIVYNTVSIWDTSRPFKVNFSRKKNCCGVQNVFRHFRFLIFFNDQNSTQ